MSNFIKAFLAFALYVASAVGANIATSNFGLVPVGFGLLVTAGTFFAGLSLVLRDLLHERLGGKAVLVAIGLGIILSFVTADPFVALASGVAFAVSELVDTGIFTSLRRYGLALAILASGAVSMVVDTWVFLHAAGFPVTSDALLGQSLVKGGLTALAAGAAFAWKRRRA